MPYEKPPNPEGLFDEFLENIPEGDVSEAMEAFEKLANDPRFEVIRDSRGRPVLFRMRQH